MLCRCLMNAGCRADQLNVCVLSVIVADGHLKISCEPPLFPLPLPLPAAIHTHAPTTRAPDINHGMNTRAITAHTLTTAAAAAKALRLKFEATFRC